MYNDWVQSDRPISFKIGRPMEVVMVHALRACVSHTFLKNAVSFGNLEPYIWQSSLKGRCHVYCASDILKGQIQLKTCKIR